MSRRAIFTPEYKKYLRSSFDVQSFKNVVNGIKAAETAFGSRMTGYNKDFLYMLMLCIIENPTPPSADCIKYLAKFDIDIYEMCPELFSCKCVETIHILFMLCRVPAEFAADFIEHFENTVHKTENIVDDKHSVTTSSLSMSGWSVYKILARKSMQAEVAADSIVTIIQASPETVLEWFFANTNPIVSEEREKIVIAIMEKYGTKYVCRVANWIRT